MAKLPEQVRWRLANDYPFYSETCLRIVDTSAQMVPFTLRPVQHRFWDVLETQRVEGRPQRAIVLKARKVGISTQVQGIMMQRITQAEHLRALVVAQDNDTAGELFGIGEKMHAYLPSELGVKPPIASRLRGRELYFGEPTRSMREQGHLGLDSSLKVDTAREAEAGRGFTYHLLHLSEVGFWPDPKKMLALINAVPDQPGTMVVQESTANGYNHFREAFVMALEGKSDYAPFFSPWLEEPTYQRAFLTEEERQDFIGSIGDGPYGEDEPALYTVGVPVGDQIVKATPEQLNWRRWAIANKAQGDLRSFQQEYPARWEEAFLATGSTVFSMQLVGRLLAQTDETDKQAEVGRIEPESWETKRVRFQDVQIPRNPGWKPQPYALDTGVWRVWEQPQEDQRYVVACDPMSGEDSEKHAFHSIQVLNHVTLEQAAEYASREDPDLLAVQIYLAANYWNRGWVAVEKTGGYGLSIIRRLYRDWGYPLLYSMPKLDQRTERMEHRFGWDTQRRTKPILEDGAREVLRTGTREGERVGINSRQLAHEMTTYVRDDLGRTGPQDGYFSDRLMAYMIALQVAHEKIPSRFRKVEEKVEQVRQVMSRAGGY